MTTTPILTKPMIIAIEITAVILVFVLTFAGHLISKYKHNFKREFPSKNWETIESTILEITILTIIITMFIITFLELGNC